MNDRTLLYAATFGRSLGVGAVAIVLGVHLKKLALPPEEIGLIFGAGMAGTVAAALLATLAGDRIGRRRLLAALGVLGALGGAGVALASHPLALAAAAFLGMTNSMGRDRGAALVLEQAIVPGTAVAHERTSVFARYNVVGDVGHALGGALAALPAGLVALGFAELPSRRATLLVCAALALATAPLSLALSKGIEASGPTPALPRLAPESRRVLTRVSALFALDSLGGGFLSTAWLAYFFTERFEASEASLGLLFVGARTLNALSHLGAAWLAARIGLVNTMVFTHIPSSLLFLTVLVAPSFPVACVLFLLREGLSQMDVPTRQSYLMAVVRPEERVVASGVTHLVRLGSWAVAPTVAGFLVQSASLASPFALGAGLKLSYDVLLYFACRNIRPPEEAIVSLPLAATVSPADPSPVGGPDAQKA